MIQTFMNTDQKESIRSKLILWIREKYGDDTANDINAEWDELNDRIEGNHSQNKFSRDKKVNKRLSNRIRNYAIRNNLNYNDATTQMREKGIIK